MRRTEKVCWTTWNASGYMIYTSRAHIIDPERDTHTLCGRFIPNTHENGEMSDGICKRCEAKENR